MVKDDDLGKIIFFFRICRKKLFAEHSAHGSEWDVDRRGYTGSGWTSVTFSSSSAQFLDIWWSCVIIRPFLNSTTSPQPRQAFSWFGALVIQPSTLAALLKLVRKSCIHREVDDHLVCSLNLADVVELYVVSWAVLCSSCRSCWSRGFCWASPWESWRAMVFGSLM